MRTTLHVAVLAGACLLAPVAVPSIAHAKTAKSFDITGSFAGEHGTKAQPAGNVTGHYDASKKSLTYTISYSGLSGPVMAAHFHGPAAPTAEAGVLVPIKPPYASPISGHASLTTAEAKDLRDGMVYVNLHTAASPAGRAPSSRPRPPARERHRQVPARFGHRGRADADLNTDADRAIPGRDPWRARRAWRDLSGCG